MKRKKHTSRCKITITFVLKQHLDARLHAGRQDPAPGHGKRRDSPEGCEKVCSRGQGRALMELIPLIQSQNDLIFLSSLLHSLEEKLQHRKYINTIFPASKKMTSLNIVKASR